MPSVTGPSPMEVKKLMLKRMLRGVSCVHATNALTPLQTDLNAVLHDVGRLRVASIGFATWKLLKSVTT